MRGTKPHLQGCLHLKRNAIKGRYSTDSRIRPLGPVNWLQMNDESDCRHRPWREPLPVAIGDHSRIADAVSPRRTNLCGGMSDLFGWFLDYSSAAQAPDTLWCVHYCLTQRPCGIMRSRTHRRLNLTPIAGRMSVHSKSVISISLLELDFQVMVRLPNPECKTRVLGTTATA